MNVRSDLPDGPRVKFDLPRGALLLVVELRADGLQLLLEEVGLKQMARPAMSTAQPGDTLGELDHAGRVVADKAGGEILGAALHRRLSGQLRENPPRPAGPQSVLDRYPARAPVI
eukprot:5889028-Pyramimonas_sp.AAC.1